MPDEKQDLVAFASTFKRFLDDVIPGVPRPPPEFAKALEDHLGQDPTKLGSSSEAGVADHAA